LSGLVQPSVTAELMTELSDLIHRGQDWDRIGQIRETLAEEFGCRKGWIWSRRPFTLSQRARRSNHARRQGPQDAARIIDHTHFYREAKRPYLPAALVSHLYDWPEVDPAVEHACHRLGLRYEAVIDFPSWWYPGRTQIVLYMRVSS
jgi:hypothetical protein